MPHNINSLPASLIPQQRIGALKQAAVGRHLLVVIDDVWDVGHLKALTFHDRQTRSAVLVTTRLRNMVKRAMKVADYIITQFYTPSRLSLSLVL
jgi:hypothetical protein